MQKSAFGRCILMMGIVCVEAAVLTLAVDNGTAKASPLTDEARTALVKNAEESCFDGQSKQEANKSREPEVLHAFCYCFGEKMSYTMTMEKTIAAYGEPFAPTQEEQQLMRAVFDNCWAVNIK
jgi:hypothetical protein